MELSPRTGQALLVLAARAIRARLDGRDLGVTPILDGGDENDAFAGCFVSLHELHSHALRGCIGMLQSGQPLLQSVVDAAHGVLRDPRFTQNPVTLEHLPALEIEITLLGPLRPAGSPMDFDPLTQGILLTIGGANGCFLPQVARDTGWTREQLLSRLCTEKLRTDALAWKNPQAALSTFEVQILGPLPFEQAIGP